MTAELDAKLIQFSRDFSSGITAEGVSIRFTKSEARALAYLSGLPGRVVTRDQLLDAVSEYGSEKTDRSVDFLINRLRKKLSDSPKNPKYIGSRYSEGYVWLAEPNGFSENHGSVYILIGPLRWPPTIPQFQDTVRQFAENLKAQLEHHCMQGQDIVIDEAYDRTIATESTRPDYTIDLTLIRNAEDAAAILMTKSSDGMRLIQADRFQILEDILEPPEDFVPTLLAKIWKDRATLHRDVPLPVAMHDFIRTNDQSEISWNEADARIKALRRAAPDDPELKLMYAAHLHTKYVLLGPELFYKGTDSCEEDEALIETLVLEALPYVEGRPEYAAISAKLLHFLRKGYDNRAHGLAEGAHSQSVNVASTLTAVGQLRCFKGDFAGAEECFAQVIPLCDRASDFHVYTLVLLVQVHLAANNQQGVKEVKKELYSVKPSAVIYFEVLLTNPDRPSLRAKAATMMLSKKRARAILDHMFYICGRLYSHEIHRENMMRTPIMLFKRRFGNDILTEEMTKAMPNLAN
jgi:hypothetical protein